MSIFIDCILQLVGRTLCVSTVDASVSDIAGNATRPRIDMLIITDIADNATRPRIDMLIITDIAGNATRPRIDMLIMMPV